MSTSLVAPTNCFGSKPGDLSMNGCYVTLLKCDYGAWIVYPSP